MKSPPAEALSVDVPRARAGTLVVKELEAASVERWERFVEGCSEATFFHRAGWKTVIERAFGHATHFLLAESEHGVEGVLPLGHIRSRLFGNALISTPFCVYGGVAATTERARDALEASAEALAERLGVDYLELRNRVAHRSDWPTKELYWTFRKRIESDPEKNLLAIPRKQRAVVRKGMEGGLASEIDPGVDRLWAAYSESVRNLGTPVFARTYFEVLRQVFPRDSEVLTVTRGGRAVASVLSFYFRDQVLPYYGGGTSEARRCHANDFLYWEVMRRASERGVRIFDYGRSKDGTGSFHFKKNWGFAPEPLPYQYRLVRAREVPNVSPANPKYRLLVGVWRRVPLTVSNWVGPWIARSLG